jgi:hypothetical protein
MKPLPVCPRCESEIERGEDHEVSGPVNQLIHKDIHLCVAKLRAKVAALKPAPGVEKPPVSSVEGAIEKARAEGWIRRKAK